MQLDKDFLPILRSILWGTDTSVSDHIDWQTLLNLAARHSCLHAFSMWLKAHHISTPFDQHLQVLIFRTLQRQVRLNHLTQQVIQLLQQHHIPATLIKGYGLSTLYPDPDMRQFGDVDIYVGPQHYLRATEIVSAAFPNAHWHSVTNAGIHFILVIDENQDRVIEIHRVAMEVADKQADALFQHFTQQHLDSDTTTIHINDTPIPIPSLSYNALYVFMHAWHHFESTGVGLRQLGDWALVLQLCHQQLTPQEWEQLTLNISHILSAMRMKTVWQTFGHVLVHQLGLSPESFPLYTKQYRRRAQRLYRQILRDGHGARPSAFRLRDIALMRCFPYERPKTNRILQKVYTVSRLFFQAVQLAKLFPCLAVYLLFTKIGMVFVRKQ